MITTGFLVLGGSYEDITSDSFLYVRPTGTDVTFTVRSVLGGDEELDSIIGKVIITNYITESYVSAIISQVEEKTFRLYDPFDGKSCRVSESLIILTAQLTSKIVQDSGGMLYCFDAIFPLALASNFEGKAPGNIGDWLELEITLDVIFDDVLTKDDWLRLNPELP
jgi:hypothetical protein